MERSWTEKKQKHYHDLFVLNLMQAVFLFMMIAVFICFIIFIAMGIHARQQNLGETGFQKYMQEYDQLDDEIKSLKNGWNFGVLKQEYPKIEVTFGMEDDIATVDVKKGDIHLRYEYTNYEIEPLELTSKPIENDDSNSWIEYSSLELKSKPLEKDAYEKLVRKELILITIIIVCIFLITLGCIFLEICVISETVSYRKKEKHQIVDEIEF